VINATGVILHTNLGRAPLTDAVVEEFRRTATQYSNLEYDLAAGARAARRAHLATAGASDRRRIRHRRQQCAAAVLLVLAALLKAAKSLSRAAS